MLLALDLPYWAQSLLRVLGGLVAVLLPAGTIVYVFLFKMMSFMQSRLGPMEAGPYGSMQLFAEVGKWLQKEDIMPEKADHSIFRIAPLIVLASTFLLVVVVPFGPDAYFGEQLHRAVRTGFHRAEAALHEAHHLEQEQIDDGARRQEHGDRATEHPEQRLAPVGNGDGDHQRSMSPRMKYSDARIVMMSGTSTPRSTHGTTLMLLKLAERILTRNGPRSPLLTT